MVIIGYILFIAGFLAGAYVAALDTTEVNWLYFGASVAVGAVGVALIRIAHHQKHKSTEAVEENIQAVFDSLKKITENIGLLNTQAAEISPYDVRHKIDELFIDDLETFVEARHSIAHLHGLQAYADIMSHFAAAERYLNRVWSASADGYIDEVKEYLQRSKDQFEEAYAGIEKLKLTTTV